MNAVCPVLNVANGLIQYSDGQEIGSTATLTCDDGYQPDGSGISVVCSETGWGTNITSCSRKFYIQSIIIFI